MKTKIIKKPLEGSVESLMTKNATRYIIPDDGSTYTEYQTDDTGSIRKLVGSDTLADVTKRGNSTKTTINLTSDNDTVTVSFGLSDKNNLWVSNFDKGIESNEEKVKGRYNTFYGMHLLPKEADSNRNVFVGRSIGRGLKNDNIVVGTLSMLNSGTAGSSNVIIGNKNIFKASDTVEYSTIIGSYNLGPNDKSLVKKVSQSVILGQYLFNNTISSGSLHNFINIGNTNFVTAGNLNEVNINDLPQGKIIKQLRDFHKDGIYGYKSTPKADGSGNDETVSAFSAGVFIGGYNETGYGGDNPVNRTVGTINIGSGNIAGMWRNYFNITIGNHIGCYYNNKSNPYSRWGNVFIGNFLHTWHDDFTLAIHSSVDEFTHVQNALIYGKFDERFVKVNGKLKLNTEYSNAEGDDTFTKQVVAKSDGTIGIKDSKKTIVPQHHSYFVDLTKNELPFTNDELGNLNTLFNDNEREEDRFDSHRVVIKGLSKLRNNFVTVLDNYTLFSKGGTEVDNYYYKGIIEYVAVGEDAQHNRVGINSTYTEDSYDILFLNSKTGETTEYRLDDVPTVPVPKENDGRYKEIMSMDDGEEKNKALEELDKKREKESEIAKNSSLTLDKDSGMLGVKIGKGLKIYMTDNPHKTEDKPQLLIFEYTPID